MPSHMKIFALLTSKPGRDELKALLLDMAPHCRAEAGNLCWDVWHDEAQPGRFALDELYADEAAVANHRQTSYYKHYLSRLQDLADRTALALIPLLVVSSGQ